MKSNVNQKRANDREDKWHARMNDLESLWLTRMAETRIEYQDNFNQVTKKTIGIRSPLEIISGSSHIT